MKKTLIAILSVVLAACCPYLMPDLKPALLEQQSAQSYQEISQIIATALGQDSVKLSGTLFVDSSILALEKPDLTGRNLDLPPRFQLLQQGSKCLLTEVGTDNRWELEHAKCSLEN